MPYLDDQFLLYNDTARRLFHEVAVDQPIIDYHNHLSPSEIANDQRWENIADMWLGSDHYKWRLLRANGINEERITGNASPRDKFQAFAETIPYTLRNPMHHWVHMELQRYFGINTLLSPKSADEIWEKTNAKLSDKEFSARGLLKKFDVRVVGTTDDPADSIDDHLKIAASGFSTKVVPTFRPDNAFQVDRPDLLNPWITRLESVSNTSITQLSDLLSALQKRHDDFHAAGARLSDHGLDRCPALPCSDMEAAKIFNHARAGKAVSAEDKERFSFYLLVFSGQLDAARGWTKQLHLNPVRNTNVRMSAKLGSDAGYDTMGDVPQGEALAVFLNALESREALPKTILYNLNPRDNYLFASMTGVFQDGIIPGKIQFGSGWWFLDQKEGIEMQLNALSSTGLISRFVGMLTDSRSFLSFPRHEYFRRILCNLIGAEAEKGELPDDFETLSKLIADISFHNANQYFGFNV